MSYVQPTWTETAGPWLLALITVLAGFTATTAHMRRAIALERVLQEERTRAAAEQLRLRGEIELAALRAAHLEHELRDYEAEVEQLYDVVQAMRSLGEALRERVGLPGPAMDQVPELPPRRASPPGPAVQAAREGTGVAAAMLATEPEPPAPEPRVDAFVSHRAQLVTLPRDTGPWTVTLAARPAEGRRSERITFVAEVVGQQWEAWKMLSQMIDDALDRRNRAARPAIRPTWGPVTSGFGWRAGFYGMQAFHTGIDISLPVGTPVVATADGVVTHAGMRAGFGVTVEIQHADGLLTLYGHLSRSLVVTGQPVGQGQAIALSGNTGFSTGPHLHYEVRLHGTAVDPARYWTS